jgi:hypothetical protein
VNLKAADLARKLATINTGTQTASPEAPASPSPSLSPATMAA